MAGGARVVATVCDSAMLVDGGPGVRFSATRDGKSQPCFAIRFQGRVYGYFNECRHQRSELDWNPGEFFDHAKLYLICATHGALYAPDSGKCVSGPCRGAHLLPLQLHERNGLIICDEA